MASAGASGTTLERNVDWDGPGDTNNPRNWPVWRKWATLLGVSCFCLIAMLSSTMIAPAAPIIQKELGIESAFVMECALSVYFLGMGIGPLMFGPASEVLGRYPVLLAGNAFFLAWNTIGGFATNQSGLVAFRFFTGVGASTPIALAGGIIGDIWPPESRGQVIAVYTCIPLLGPAIGPIVGGFVTQDVHWRWVFWCFSIIDAALLLLVLSIFRESYAPRLLYLKAKRESQAADDHMFPHTPLQNAKRVVVAVSQNLGRPVRILSHGISQILCAYGAILFGIMYLLMFNFPTLWTQVYGEEDGVASLNYLSIALGLVIGSQITGWVSDTIYRRLKKKNNGKGAPEYRVVIMAPASLVAPMGVLLFAWTGQHRVHWIVPNIGSFFFSVGFIACLQVVSAYTIEAYGRFAASALSAQACTRFLMGFCFPLFADAVYSSLGIGWGNTLLAGVLFLLAATVPLALRSYGTRLRRALSSDPSAEK